MDESFYRKYKRLLEVLPDVAECAEGRLILAGGTALSLFHLKHRISIDLDFVPAKGDDVELKEALKGCLSKKGYRTLRSAYTNQFVIQFEDSSIKVEVFTPRKRIGAFDEHPFGNAKLKVASLDDLLWMKLEAYAERKEARDLFDCAFIMKRKGDLSPLRKLIAQHGLPPSLEDAEKLAFKEEDYKLFLELVKDASKTGHHV